MEFREGVLQLPVIPWEGVKPGAFVSASGGGWHTGIRCPRCQEREVIYNGNYFCSGYGWVEDEMLCDWALPDAELPPHTEPHHVLLQEALIASQGSRS